MKTLGELHRRVAQEAPAFAQRLQQIKANHAEIEWYPFRSMDKIHLIDQVVQPLDGVALADPGRPPRVLDVGAADGEVAFLYASLGCEVVAIDNAPSNYNRCQGIRCLNQSLDHPVELVEKDIDYDFAVPGQFDLVLFMDILYHLRNPLGCLIALGQMGAHMVLTTRIFEELPGSREHLQAPCGYLLAPFEAAANDPTNYWIFTETALERLLDRSGWRVLRTAHFGYTGKDASPSDPQRDKRVVCLCERRSGWERLKDGHYIEP